MLKLSYDGKLAGSRALTSITATVMGLCLALTTLPVVPAYAAEQHEFVMPTAKIKVGNPNYLSRIEGGTF